jgi:hypothetical protein
VRQECDGHINDLSAIHACPRRGRGAVVAVSACWIATWPAILAKCVAGWRYSKQSSLARVNPRQTPPPGSIRRRFRPESGSDRHRPAAQAIERCLAFPGGALGKNGPRAQPVSCRRRSGLLASVLLPPAKCRLARALLNLADAAVSDAPPVLGSQPSAVCCSLHLGVDALQRDECWWEQPASS